MNPILVVEPGSGVQAALEALRRRMRGERFDCLFAVPDDRALVATALLPAFLPQAKTYDERCVVLDMLADRKLVANGTPQAELSGIAPDDRVAMRECGYLADRIRVTSWQDAERLAAFFGLPADQFERFAPEPATIPLPPEHRRGSMVLVYAPGVPAALTAIIVHALEGRAGGTVVYGDRSLCGGTSAEFVGDPIRALATAAVIVVASATDPAVACALAALGAPLAVASSSGAREYLENIAVFEPWSRSSILGAVSEAIGAAAPRVRAAPELPEPAPAPIASTQPLVSIVVRTKDRVRFLARALASCAAQTYPNIEVVIVNDGGVPIDEVLPVFPTARVVVHPTSLGAGKTLADGMAATTGTYVMELDDDDIIFPDHIEQLVNVLEMTGAGAVNAMTVSIYGEPCGDGGYDLVGMGTFLRKTNRRDRIPVEDGIGPMATLFRRSALYAAGGPDPEISHADDWMMLARVAQQCDVLYLRAVTAAYTIRNDFSSMMTTRGADLIASLERMAVDLPLDDRPALARERAAMIERTRATGGVATFPAAAVRFAGGALL